MTWHTEFKHVLFKVRQSYSGSVLSIAIPMPSVSWVKVVLGLLRLLSCEFICTQRFSRLQLMERKKKTKNQANKQAEKKHDPKLGLSF